MKKMNRKLIHVGTLGQPVGLKGEVKINIYTENLKSFRVLKKYFIDEGKTEIYIKSIRHDGKKYILSLKNYNDRNSILLLKGKFIFSYRENFPKVKKNEYYVIDLIGHKVKDIKSKILGQVFNIDNFGAGNLLEIKTKEGKKIYIPMNNDNLVSIDSQKKIIIVNPVSGLLE